MSQRSKNIIISIVPIVMLILTLFITKADYFESTTKLVLSFFTIFFSLIYAVYKGKLPVIASKFLIVASYSMSCGMFIYYMLDQYDLLKYFTSITAIKELILATGGKGVFIFVLIQIAQVVFLPIPAVALIVVGIVVFGPIKTMILCTIGVLLGSYISFMVGKTFGYKFVSWLLGEEKVERYSKLLKNNGKYILSIVFIFPFFPDDLFCMVAGISPMTFKEFFIIATCIRPITIIVLCLFGGGTIFSLNSIVGIIIILILVVICTVGMIIFFKKNRRIRALFKN